MTAGVRIPAYYSHSYRAEDRELNTFFLRLLWQHGFTLAVDPKSSALSTTHLELMMRDSACFVGVLARRDEQPRYRCSPFAIYEYELARRARKPLILFVEAGVPSRFFESDDPQFVFDRDRLGTFDVPVAALRKLRDKGLGYVDRADRPIGRVGMLLPRTPEYAEAAPLISALLDDAGYQPVEVPQQEMEAAYASIFFDSLDFVVTDVASRSLPSWTFPFLQGAFVPSVKLVYHVPGQGALPKLATLATSAALATGSGANRVVLWWRTTQELVSGLDRHISKLHRPRRQFQTIEQGERYFRSLGRSQGPVFLSNAQTDNELAREVARHLDLYNIEYFHYQYRNTIPLGTSWKARLLSKVEESRIFVPLISEAYWRSNWCTQELAVAQGLQRQGRLTLIPYFLDNATGVTIEVQGAPLAHVPEAERPLVIVTQIDRQLTEDADLSRRPQAVATSDPQLSAPDVVAVATTREYYEALVECLDGVSPITGVSQQPDGLGWRAGTIATGRGRYRMVVALVETDPVAAAAAVHTTVTVFRPGCVALVGPATGTGRDMGSGRLRTGDVIVADRLYGFSSSGPGGVAHPRPDWNFPLEISAAAISAATPDSAATSGPTQTVPVRPRVWRERVAVGDGQQELTPTGLTEVLAGWSDAVAVEPRSIGVIDLLDDLRQRGRLNQFLAIYGVADVLGEPGKTLQHAGAEASPAATPARLTADVLIGLVRNAWSGPPRADAMPADSRGMSEYVAPTSS